MPGKKKAEAPSPPMELTLREEKSIVAQVHPPRPPVSPAADLPACPRGKRAEWLSCSAAAAGSFAVCHHCYQYTCRGRIARRRLQRVACPTHVV